MYTIEESIKVQDGIRRQAFLIYSLRVLQKDTEKIQNWDKRNKLELQKTNLELISTNYLNQIIKTKKWQRKCAKSIYFGIPIFTEHMPFLNYSCLKRPMLNLFCRQLK